GACYPLFPYTTFFRSDFADDLHRAVAATRPVERPLGAEADEVVLPQADEAGAGRLVLGKRAVQHLQRRLARHVHRDIALVGEVRSGEHTSELQSREKL